METYDRLAHVKQLHEMRKKNTIQKVDEAIQRLVRARENINFNSVASEAGVSKATLYNNVEIRKRIESLREQQSHVPTPKQIKREIDENNKDALIESLKRRIKKLEDESKQLREQLKVTYADVYKKI
ncbi:TPA: transposase [Bacillus cereus]|nr:transposase [Bacillus cereus]